MAVPRLPSSSYLLYLPPVLICKDINTRRHANALSADALRKANELWVIVC